MGILGVKLKKRVRRVTVGFDEDGKEVVLELRAPRLAEIDALDVLFPEPQPPPLKDSAGRNQTARGDDGRVLKDEYGSPMILRNKDDPKHAEKINRIGQARTICMVVSCIADLKPAKNLEDFKGDRVEYYHYVWEELEADGLGVGAFKALVAAAMHLGRPMGADEIEDARKVLGSDNGTQKAVKAELGDKAPKGK